MPGSYIEILGFITRDVKQKITLIMESISHKEKYHEVNTDINMLFRISVFTMWHFSLRNIAICPSDGTFSWEILQCILLFSNKMRQNEVGWCGVMALTASINLKNDLEWCEEKSWSISYQGSGRLDSSPVLMWEVPNSIAPTSKQAIVCPHHQNWAIVVPRMGTGSNWLGDSGHAKVFCHQAMGLKIKRTLTGLGLESSLGIWLLSGFSLGDQSLASGLGFQSLPDCVGFPTHIQNQAVLLVSYSSCYEKIELAVGNCLPTKRTFWYQWKKKLKKSDGLTFWP